MDEAANQLQDEKMKQEPIYCLVEEALDEMSRLMPCLQPWV